MSEDVDSVYSLFKICLFATVTAVCVGLHFLYTPRHAPSEPPVVASSIPYIGHILGLLRHGTRYYQITSARCKLPIYTLRMLHGKVYVVTSPELINAVNRNSKSLAFNPFIAQLGKRITGHDEKTSQIVQHNLNGEEGSGYVIEIHDGHVVALAHGENLKTMTGLMLKEASIYLDALETNNEIQLFTWTRRMMTLCSTRAIYGPENPFNKNSRYNDLFWDFDHDLNLLMVDVVPSLSAPKGNRARSELAVAFQRYFENYIPGQTQSAAMIHTRYTVNTKHGVSLQDQGRLEVGTLLGILANTIPSTFYMLVRVYSDPALLQDIRNELETTSVSTIPNETKGRILRVISMQEKCELLHSTFQELLRFHAHGAGARLVREDTILDNQYLLRKGMVVQMPMSVMHSDPSIWGPDAGDFNSRRFLKQQDGNQKTKQYMTAYRPFGGGASLCPGRHFVTLEVLALTAYMVLKFDITPSDGQWVIPVQKQESMATNVFPPEKDITVQITRRKGFADVDWGFVMD